MLALSRCWAVALLLAVVPPTPAQGPKKPPTLDADRQALMGDWQIGPVQDGNSKTMTKLRITDRYLRMLIFYESPGTFEAGGSQFEYKFVEQDGKRVILLYGYQRDQVSGTLTYRLDGGRLRLEGEGVALNNRKYDLTGTWARPIKKKKVDG